MSPVISGDRRQLTLQLEPGLTERFRCTRDVVAQGVYARGLKRMAAELEMAPGNLSVALGDEGSRKFGVDELERYIERSGDLTPIYYLIERFLGDQGATHAEALDRVLRIAEQLKALPDMLAAAGLAEAKPRKR